MTITIDPVDPQSASHEDLDGYFELTVATSTIDRPDALLPSRGALVQQLRTPDPNTGEQRFWLAREDGRVVGSALLYLLPDPNSHLALVKLLTEPDQRRRGIGTQMLRQLLPELSAADRHAALGLSLTADGAGDSWARGLGFRETQRLVMQSFPLHDGDGFTEGDYGVPGYRVVDWREHAPEPLLRAFAEARKAIYDAPRAASSQRRHEWSADRVRADERELADSGILQHVAVALHEATGEIHAVTVVQEVPGQQGLARQLDTAVHPGFRRRGLALMVKARMLQVLRASRPEVQRVLTNVAASNAAMLGVNERLGFVRVRSMISVEASIEELRRHPALG